MPRIAFYTFEVLYAPMGHPSVQSFWEISSAMLQAAERTRFHCSINVCRKLRRDGKPLLL
jgi:hypothetical protein